MLLCCPNERAAECVLKQRLSLQCWLLFFRFYCLVSLQLFGIWDIAVFGFCSGYLKIFREKEEGWTPQTDLPRLHNQCPEIHGPWWFQRSSNHRPKNPPADSEPSPKSLCCCQPWQELKEAPNCPNYQKLQGTNRGRDTEENREEGESKEEEKGDNCQTKGRRHKLARLQTKTARVWQFNWRESNTFVNFVKKKKHRNFELHLFRCLHNVTTASIMKNDNYLSEQIKWCV